jgi:hypothetical protein
MIPDLSSLVPLLVAFFALAAVAGLLAVYAVVDVVVTHRRTRLARHQGGRTYHRGLALTH